MRVASDQGSAPNMPTLSEGRSDSISSATSARCIAYDGVQWSAVTPKSLIISICRFVLPVPAGRTVMPIRSAP